MKKIKLWIAGEQFVIEECEGTAEIRKASEVKSCAASRRTFGIGRSPQWAVDGSSAVTFDIKVEIAE